MVGIVTQRDFFPAGVSSALGADSDRLGSVTVRSIMRRETLQAHPDTDLGHAGEMMVRERIGCLSAVEDGQLVGLLTETDCLRHLADLLRLPAHS